MTLAPAEIDAILLSVRVALVAVVFSIAPGCAVAYALARGRFRGRLLLDGLVHLPLVMPPVITGYLLLLAFGPQGPAGRLLAAAGMGIAFTWTGAALAAAIMAFPLMVRAMRLSFESVDRRTEDAARTLGRGALGTFFSITLPQAMPGVLAGMVLAFAKALGEFGATITFVSSIPGETRTIALAVNDLIQTPGGETRVVPLLIVSISLSFGALIASEVISRRIGRRARAP